MRNRKAQEADQLDEGMLCDLGAWEGEGEAAESGGNILKQFRRNLNNYERTYHDHKHSQLIQQPREKADKENAARIIFPALPLQPKKQIDYSQFLESQPIKGNQKQQSSLIHYKQPKTPRLNPQKQVVKGRSRCESFVQFYRNSAEHNLQDLFLRKHRGFSISRTLKFSKMKERRNSTQALIEDGLQVHAKLSSELPMSHRAQ